MVWECNQEYIFLSQVILHHCQILLMLFIDTTRCIAHLFLMWRHLGVINCHLLQPHQLYIYKIYHAICEYKPETILTQSCYYAVYAPTTLIYVLYSPSWNCKQGHYLSQLYVLHCTVLSTLHLLQHIYCYSSYCIGHSATLVTNCVWPCHRLNCLDGQFLIFILLIMDMCLNTCFHRRETLVQFHSNLPDFGFTNNSGFIASSIWLVAVCKLQTVKN